MSSFEDIYKKVRDLIEKGFYAEKPLSCKITLLKDSFSVIHKSDFLPLSGGTQVLTFENTWKYEKPKCCMVSQLITPSKYEVEAEKFFPLPGKTEKDNKIHGKIILQQKSGSGSVDESSWKSLQQLPLDCDFVLDGKFKPISNLITTLKFETKKYVLYHTLSNLFSYKNFFAGGLVTFKGKNVIPFNTDHLAGYKCNDCTMYVRNSVKIEKNEDEACKLIPTTILGFHCAKKINCQDLDKYFPTPDFSKTIELGLEAKMEQLDYKHIFAQFAYKFALTPEMSFQEVYNSKLDYTGNVTIQPQKWIKIHTSYSLNLLKAFTQPHKGFGFKYGFAFEMTPEVKL